jgi:hypothetical protein
VPTHEVAVFCKSFRDDFDRLKLLVESIEAQSIDTPVLISVPESDIQLLRSLIPFDPRYTVVSDESYVIPGAPFPYGWYQQQVCKLSIYRTDFAKSYIMIDSDTYFIKGIEDTIIQCRNENIVASDIYTKFFSYNDKLKNYLRDKETDSPSVHVAGDIEGFDARNAALTANMEEINKKGAVQRGAIINHLFSLPNLAFQPAQLFHARILSAFSSFLNDRGMDFYSIIRLSPWEYNWYASFALANWPMKITGICSPVLHFASQKDVSDAKEMGFTIDDFKRRFIAVQMAARHFDGLQF